MRVLLVLAAILTVLGFSVAGIYGASTVSLPGPAPPQGTQFALVLYGNQCAQPSGALSGCAPICGIYSCTAVPSASPGVLEGTTDASGNVQLTLGSYSDGAGSGFYTCPSGGEQFVAWQFPPFYQGYAYLSGQWQIQGLQWQPGPSVYGCNPPVFQSSSPYQFQQPIKDAATGTTYWVNVTVCIVSCGSEVTYTTTVSGTVTTYTTTQPTTVTATSTATSYSTYTTTVTGTSIVSGTATTYTTTATVTAPAITSTTTVQGATQTSTVTQTSVATQTVTRSGTTSTVTVTATVVGKQTRIGPLSEAGAAGLLSLGAAVMLVAVDVTRRRK